MKEIIFSLKEKKEFFNAFYFQYKSGLSLLDTFKSIKSSSQNAKIKHLCTYVLNKIEKGNSLKEAISKKENVLSSAYTALICAGEETGKLEDTLLNILQNIKKEEEVKHNLISSLSYPVGMFFCSIAVLLFFKFFVFEVFNLMSEGEYIQNIPLFLLIVSIKIIIILAVIFLVLFHLVKNEKIKHFLLKNYYLQSFFTTLALSYESGIAAAEALTLSNSVIKIDKINHKIKQAIKKVEKGSEITSALSAADVFSDFAISQISAGEKAGELDKMFKIIASDYENKMEATIKLITKLTGPLMTLFVGIIVLYTALSAYSRYYDAIFSMI